MGHLFEAELREEAEKFIDALTVAGFQAQIDHEGFRDYLVKVAIQKGQTRLGYVKLHFSPKRKKFSITTDEIRDNMILPTVEAAWVQRSPDKQEAAPSRSTQPAPLVSTSHNDLPADESSDQGVGIPSTKTSSLHSSSNHLEQLLEKAHAFLDVLRRENISASIAGILNNQYVRVKFQPSGVMDLYVTARRSPDRPDLKGFLDPQLQTNIEKLWNAYYQGRPQPETVEGNTAAVFTEIDYLYNLLLPYRDCQFDFGEFARALERARGQTECEQITAPLPNDFENFSKLETIYHQIKSRGETK